MLFFEFGTVIDLTRRPARQAVWDHGSRCPWTFIQALISVSWYWGRCSVIVWFFDVGCVSVASQAALPVFGDQRHVQRGYCMFSCQGSPTKRCLQPAPLCHIVFRLVCCWSLSTVACRYASLSSSMMRRKHLLLNPVRSDRV